LEPVRISRSAVEAQSKKRAKDAAEAPAQPGAAAVAGAPAAGATTTAAPTVAPTAPAVAAAQPPAASGKKGAGKAAQKSAAPAGPRLFLLSLYDDVEVVSYEGDRTTTVRGDRLDAYFIMKGGSGMSLAAQDPFGPPSAPFPEVALPGNRAAQLAALAIAAAPDDDALVTVAFTGRLVMAPAPEGTPTLGQPEGVRMVVNGRPARIEDSKSQAVLQAKRISLESKVDRVELVGAVDDPASIETPSFTLAAAHFTLDRSTGRGGSDGPGTIAMGGSGLKLIVVSWAKQMTLALQPGTGDAEGSFRGAEFTGDVDVRSPDIELHAGQLSVEALPVGKKDVVRRIVASGAVQAKSLGSAGGHFGADRVEIALTPNDKDEAQPRTLLATGNVMAGDGGQTLWASTLRATFVEVKASWNAAVRAGADAKAARDASDTDRKKSDLGEIVAEGPVELRMADGGRVFANRLEGDGLGRNARLVGPDVLVVRGNLVLDQLANIQVQEQPARINALGPGR
ncbi:MAG: hypothetical protein EBY30_16215, partial [Rhodospirillales bacterium]|nr:hypothetical protein [Rhodospirillales bacterium]